MFNFEHRPHFIACRLTRPSGRSATLSSLKKIKQLSSLGFLRFSLSVTGLHPLTSELSQQDHSDVIAAGLTSVRLWAGYVFADDRRDNRFRSLIFLSKTSRQTFRFDPPSEFSAMSDYARRYLVAAVFRSHRGFLTRLGYAKLFQSLGRGAGAARQ